MKNEIYNDHFQNWKRYPLKKAQLIIADIPYNVGNNAYGSNPSWYIDGDNKNGESELAGKAFFDTDNDFRVAEYMHFCSQLLIKEPKEKGKSPCMIVFCSFDQIREIMEYGKKYGFLHSTPLFFIKNYSAQVLKANMRLCGATEFGVLLYRDKLPKYNNNGKMFFDWFEYPKETTQKIHPTQKPIALLKQLISLYTDEGDTVIDPVAGSGSTLVAAKQLNRNSYGFEIKKDFYKLAKEWVEQDITPKDRAIMGGGQLNLFDMEENL
jgi:site-specific DNA-methyltransferase (adenine-specific)